MADTVSEMVERACRTHASDVAIHDRTGEAILFRTLLGTILAFAEQAADAGIGKNDLCALDIGEPTAGDILRLALLRLGATVIEGRASRLTRTHEIEIAFELTDTIGDDAPPGPDCKRILLDKSWLRPPTRHVPAMRCGRLVRTTTGTTGTPKLRLLTEEVLAARLLRSSRHRGAPEGPAFVGYRPGSSPAFNHFLRAVVSGVPVVQPRGSAEASLAAMDSLKSAVAYLSPYNFGVLLEVSGRTGIVPAGLRRIVVGGSGLHPRLAARGEAQFGCPVINSYGSNETSSIASVRVVETGDRPGVVGRPYPDLDVRFRDADTGEPAEAREILVRPPDAIRSLGYPDARPIGDAGGWIATGDLGRMTGDGMVQIVGRVHDLINVGGNKRAPSFFEDIAMSLPHVDRVAAFSLPDGAGSDIVGLAVVGQKDFAIGAFAQAIHARLGATYPMQIGEMADLPSNRGGKIDRKALQDIFLGARGAGVVSEREHDEGD